MEGSIGNLAEQVLDEVRSNKLTKLAQHEIVKEAAARPNVTSPLGQALLKVAAGLRDQNDDVTVADVENLVREVNDAG